VENLGLIKTKGQLRISDKIYQEIIPRSLTGKPLQKQDEEK